MDSRPRALEPTISAIVPLKPMRCRDCLRRAMYQDSLFSNRWRLGLWTILGLLLLLLLVHSLSAVNISNSGRGAENKPASGDVSQITSGIESKEVDKNSPKESKKSSDTSTVDLSSTGFEPPVTQKFSSRKSNKTKNIDPRIAEKDILNLLEQWRLAWENSQVESYFSLYSRSFQPEEGESYRDWVKRRKDLVGKLQKRSIVLDKVRIIISENGESAGAEFVQMYQSGTYSDKVLKRLYFKQNDGYWRIAREHTFNANTN